MLPSLCRALLMVLTVTATTQFALACPDIVVHSLAEVEEIFLECGACVIQVNDHELLPNALVLVKLLLETSDFSLVKSSPDMTASLNVFTPSQKPLFSSLDFPAHTVYVFETESSANVELCLANNTTNMKEPCHPRHYRFVEVEEGDVVVFNPTKASARFCLPQDNEMFMACQKPQSGVLLHFVSQRVLLPLQPPPLQATSEKWIIGTNKDQTRLFEMADQL